MTEGPKCKKPRRSKRSRYPAYFNPPKSDTWDLTLASLAQVTIESDSIRMVCRAGGKQFRIKVEYAKARALIDHMDRLYWEIVSKRGK